MLGINVSEGTAEGWFGQGKTSAILSIIVFVALMAGIAFGIFAAINAWGSQSSAPIAPSPVPPPVTPVAPPPTEPDKHIIPQTTPTPPEPEEHEYVYNVLEFQLARMLPPLQAEFLSQELRKLGYNISKEQITAFYAQHRVREGDTVLVRGKMIGHRASGLSARGAIIQLEGVGEKTSFQFHSKFDAYVEGKPQWLSEVIERFEAGEEIVITLRGTATDARFFIKKCELVEW